MIAHAQQQPTHPGYGHPPAHPPAAPFIAPEDEKGREIERLRRELRKVEEKTEFFKKQVVNLQQQVTAMDPMGRSGGAGAYSPEMQYLQQELQREQAHTQ